MGWASGSDIACTMIQAIADNVKDKKVRKILYEKLISALENADWDTQNEAIGIDPIADKLLGYDAENEERYE